MTDDALVRRALEGDGRAFTAIVDRHAGVCLRFATRMLGSVEDAEDVTQETFFRAHRALASYDGTTAFRTWLMTILVNRCRSAMLYRHRREERVKVDGERVAAAWVNPEVNDFALREAIDRAVAALDADLREAFLLKHVEQLSYDEMAEITGAGVSALKMRVKRACDRLRDALEAEHDG
jgi:RNA polymerase sigma-70 factor (ECF subfamily)